MARPLRIEYPDAVYHVTSRGNARNDIFHIEQDRDDFLSVLSTVVKRYNWLCHAYCLMDNHYHLLIETPDGNLSEGMRQINGIYTQKYNWRHQKTGHVFQGRYKAILVDKESYLLELCRYVVLNPVRANIVARPEKWKWSSYLSTSGKKRAPEYLTTDWILGLFSRNKAEAQKQYRKFVKSGIVGSSPWKNLQGQILLGEEGFLERHRDYLTGKEKLKEIPLSQRLLNRPQLAELFFDSRSKMDGRNRLIYAAHVQYGYKLKEISEHLGMHYTTVSRAVKSEAEK
jgi:putative transposase